MPKAALGTGSPSYVRPMAHHHGTAPPRPRQPWNNFRLARGSLNRAPHRASARRKSPPRSRPHSADWGGGPTTRRDKRINLPTTPQHGEGADGVSWSRPPCRTADVTGVPSACAHHCNAITGARQVCGALCILACHTAPHCSAYPCTFLPCRTVGAP